MKPHAFSCPSLLLSTILSNDLVIVTACPNHDRNITCRQLVVLMLLAPVIISVLINGHP